jgi:hypothetical protein
MSSGVESRQKTREGGGGEGREGKGCFDKIVIVESNALGGGRGETRRDESVEVTDKSDSLFANSYIVVPSFLSR